MGKRHRMKRDDRDGKIVSTTADEDGSHDAAAAAAADDDDVRKESQSSRPHPDDTAGGCSTAAGDDDDVDDDRKSATESKRRKVSKVRRLKVSATQDFNARLERRGVVYLSRVPPRMGPAKVKTLLSDFGEVARVYLVEEDKTSRKRRRKAGGSGSKRYLEGWVEFESKRVAKRVGETLNMTRVTNHKGSANYDDIWNVKYLRGFKWSHLTEKVAYERRVREQKLRVEMMEVRRENASYVAQVEAGRRLDHIEERRRKRMEGKGDGGGGGGGGWGGIAADDDGTAKRGRKIRQKKPLEGDGSATKSAILGCLV
jgi:ESF2/ABP1 family protein